MYDTLYRSIPAFERETAIEVDILAQLPHPELNAFVRRAFESGTGDLDLLSTHTKYAPSQAEWLTPLDGMICEDDEADLLPRAAELSRVGRRLLQVPRNLDVRLLHYRSDLFEDPSERATFAARFGRQLRVPETWTELIEVAEFFTRPGLYGFMFPGRDSGLFGSFYELLVGAGGDLFDVALRPAFDSEAGVWAANYLAELHHRRRVTPRELPEWHYDEISAAFREGRAAMVCDWPGSYHLYTNPETCAVWKRVGLAALPAGPAAIHAGYAGCHSFAIAAASRHRSEAAALLRHLTSFDAQVGEARRGAIPCRQSALRQVREEAPAGSADARRWDLLSEAEHTMIIPPRFAAYPRCEEAIWQSIQRAMTGEWPPDYAVRNAASEILPILDGGAAVRP
jgi:multiple sugar transport system substrate-binding protein